MVEIPEQLQIEEPRFVLLGDWDLWKNAKTGEKRAFKPEEYDSIDKENWKPLGKAPFEKAWQKKPYHYTDAKLQKHPKNFGVIGGYGNLRMIDIDDPSLYPYFKKAIGETYTVQTGSGGYHIYIFCDYDTNHVFAGEKGEVRAHNYQVVSAPSKHPNGNLYKVIDKSPIIKIQKEKFAEIISPYLRKEAEDTKPSVESSMDTSRSGLEMSALCKLILKGRTQEECFDEMRVFAKWADGTKAYRERTYNKAIEFCYSVLNKKEGLQTKVKKNYGSEEESEKVEQENWDDAFYLDSDLKDYQRPTEEYLIDDFVPKSHIGIIVGASGERKTFAALHIALCAAAGKPVFGLFNVPKKLKVLLIDEENGKPEIDKRIKALKAGLSISDDEVLDIAYLSFFNAKLDNPSKQKRIISFIEKFKPDIIFVDCLQRVLSIDIDRENQPLSEFFTSFVRPITQKYGCTWIFVHHYRKRNQQAKFINPLDEIRGASELRNYIRFAWGVQRPGKQQDPDIDTIILKQLKLSNAPPTSDKVISFTTSEGCLAVKYEGDAEDLLATEQLAAQAIKEWLVAEGINGDFRTGDVQDAEPGGYKKTTLAAALKILANDKFLNKVKRGVWRVAAEAPPKKTQDLADFEEVLK